MKALVLKGRGHIEYISKDIPSLSDEHGVLLRPILVSPATYIQYGRDHLKGKILR